MVEQSVTASRYVDCVVTSKSVEVEERLGLCRAPKPCGRIGRERKLCRVKAVRTMAMARFAPKPCGRIGRERRLCRAKAVRTSGHIGRERRLCRVKAVRTGQEAEAKMGVILALRR